MSSNNSRAIRMEFETLRSIDGLAIPAGTYVGGTMETRAASSELL